MTTMDRTIRIGTRSSQLALWQANTVAEKLQVLGYKTKIVKIDSIGDVVLDKPLYELGITGVFTKNLDIALLNNKVDIAVNSFKDVPTALPKGIVQAAVLERGAVNDVLVFKGDFNSLITNKVTIATGSLRRKAQWLHRYPNHTIVGLRGNINTRLQKLYANNWHGAIFAKAGLVRTDLLSKQEHFLTLDWMVPAPAQGAVMVAALEKDKELLKILNKINHKETQLCVTVEREFLRILEGGCTAPIGALATISKGVLDFKGILSSPDGKIKLEYSSQVALDDEEGINQLPEIAAKDILNRGGKELIQSLSKTDKKPKVLITKVLDANQLNALHVDVDLEMHDFISTQTNKIEDSLVDRSIDTVVITSQNAVKALLDNFDKSQLDFKAIFCVGDSTKALIEQQIGTVTHCENSSEKLAHYLIKAIKNEEIYFFCSNKRRDELPKILGKNHIAVNEICCYTTILTPKKIMDPLGGVLFFSPSAIKSFVKDNKPNDAVAFCIGATTAQEAEKYFKTVIVSKTATIHSVLQAVNTYFK